MRFPWSALRRSAAALALCASGGANAIVICYCDKAPVPDLCVEACKGKKGPIVIPSPAPQAPGVNPFAQDPRDEARLDKLQIYERIDIKSGRDFQRDMQRSR